MFINRLFTGVPARAVLLCAAFVAEPAAAQTAAQTSAQGSNFDSTSTASAARLDDIQVTATRTPQRVSNTLAATTVIDRDDIERLQARSVRDLLRRTPGLTVTNNGGPGKSTSIFLRGTESDHTLVLVDGVEYRSATAGQAAIEDLPVEQIERIEIVRGPRSSLYGSDAIGGVIQIFTRNGRGVSGTRPYFQIGAGSDSAYEGQVGLSGSDENSHYNLSVSGQRTDGFDSCTAAAAGTGGCFTDEPDDDGYDRVSVAFNYGHIFDNGVEWDLNFLRAESSVDFDGTAQNSSDAIQQIIGTSLSWRPIETWRTKLAYGNSRDDSDNFLDGQYVTAFETQRHQLSWQNDITLPNDDLFTLGLDYKHESVDGDNNGDRRNDFGGAGREDSRDNKGVFVQYLGDWGRHHVQLSGRGDDNEQFGEHATGSAAYGIDFAENYTASISYGTAFKAPTFNELYFPNYGNPELDPEESDSVEVGLEGDHDWGRWSLRAYQTEIDDLIAYDSATFAPANIEDTRIRGVEASAGTVLADWQLNAQFTWLKAENRTSGPNKGNDLPRRPSHSAQFDVDRAFGRYSAGASLTIADSSYDDAANDNELDSYQLVDLRASMQVARDWLVQATLNNVFDEEYQTARFYNQADRNVFFTLRYQPQ